jgi:hypothetical protein
MVVERHAVAAHLRCSFRHCTSAGAQPAALIEDCSAQTLNTEQPATLGNGFCGTLPNDTPLGLFMSFPSPALPAV